jgi:hypothetical protein
MATNVSSVLMKIHLPKCRRAVASGLFQQNRLRMPGSKAWLRARRAKLPTTPPMASAQMLRLKNAQPTITKRPTAWARRSVAVRRPSAMWRVTVKSLVELNPARIDPRLTTGMSGAS